MRALATIHLTAAEADLLSQALANGADVVPEELHPALLSLLAKFEAACAKADAVEEPS